MPIPAEMAGKIQRGFAILEGYSHLLSDRGRQLAQDADHYFASAEQLPPEEAQNRAQELMGQMPTLQEPHLEIFTEPNSEIFDRLRRWGSDVDYRLELSTGCENQCVFCEANPPTQLTLMPFPIILLIANALRKIGGVMKFSSMRSDPFQYRDVYFGADLGDVVRFAQDVIGKYNGNILPLQTHGWRESHKYAQAAAQKINQMEDRIYRLLHSTSNRTT